MLKKITLLVSILWISTCFSWGPTGHRTVGEIASNHISKKTKRKIAKLLNNESLAFVSTFGDEIKSDRNYRKYSPWHYVNLKFSESYESSHKNPKGDLIVGIDTCIKELKNKKSSDEDKVFHLKMLVHLVGDLHQPLHVGRKEDKGGNTIQVEWFGKGTNLHRVWDENMINKWEMSYMELANNSKKLSRKERRKIKKGNVIDWVNESQKLAIKVYASAKIGDKLSYRYSYKNFGTVRSQLQKGGIRLAKILDDIF
ncbi:MAG: S1/P1 nuclease [Flavobacteriaceae bacterium]